MSVDGETLLAASARLSEHADTLALVAERYGSATVEVQLIGRSVEQHWSGTVLSERSADRIEALAATLDRIAPVIDRGGSAGIVQRLGGTAASLGREIAHLDAEYVALVGELQLDVLTYLPDAKAMMSIDVNRQTRSRRADDWLEACALAGRNVAAAAIELEGLVPFSVIDDFLVPKLEEAANNPYSVLLPGGVLVARGVDSIGIANTYADVYMRAYKAMLPATKRVANANVTGLMKLAKRTLPVAVVIGVLDWSDNLDTVRDPEAKGLDRIVAGFEMAATVAAIAVFAPIVVKGAALTVTVFTAAASVLTVAAMVIEHHEGLKAWGEKVWRSGDKVWRSLGSPSANP